MDASNPLSRIIRLCLIGLGLFAAGALLSFGYSYRPLHGAKNWKIENLEQRLDERNRENMKLSDAVARFESEANSQIDPDTFAQVEKELAKARRATEQLEKDLERAEQKRKDANASASTWRRRYEKLRDEAAAVAASVPAPDPVPAAPAPRSLSDTESVAPRPDASLPDFMPRDPASPHRPGSGMLPFERPAPASNP